MVLSASSTKPAASTSSRTDAGSIRCSDWPSLVPAPAPADFHLADYERLNPGGSYVGADHAAAAGAGTSDAQSLHRIDPASVREEVEAAGFVLDAESTMLTNKDDPHSIKVFDPSIKGETDRFAYRFLKI